MHTFVRLIFLGLLAMFMAACGGGGSGSGDAFTGGGSSTSTASAQGLVLTVGETELNADGSQTVDITVTASDSNNVLVEGATVTLSADSGIIQVLESLTNASGQITATLSTGGDETERTITITAKSGGVEVTATIDVVDGTVNLTSGGIVLIASADQLGADGSAPVSITAIVTDSNNVVVEGAEVEFSATSGALEINQPTSSPSGQAIATLSTGGDPTFRTITVSATTGALVDDIDIEVVDSPAGAKITSLDLLVSSPQLGTSAADTVEVTAIAKDSNNVVAEDIEVAFSATSGSLAVTQDTTDVAGQALATLSTEGDTENRTITVTATAGGLSSTATVDVTGTKLVISGETSLTLNSSTDLTLVLTDSDDNPIPGITLSVSSANINALTATNGSFETDSSGEVQVTVRADVIGSDTIAADAEGAMGTHTLVVSGDQFSFITPTADQEIDIEGAAEVVTVEWLSSGVPQVGKTVNFTATRGNLSATSAVTDGSGRASVTIDSTNAGPSTITAFVTSGPTTAVQVEFIATDPDAITLQADKSTIGPNDGSEAVEQKAILTATLRDANNNLVKGKTLRFVILQDTSGGTLTNATAITNSLGQASVSYVSSAASTATDEVEIRVEVEEDTSVEDTVFLTVAQKALFVKLGTGNSIAEPNGAIYEMPYSVIVTDSGGNPVEGVTVTLKVSPTAFFKGWWFFADPIWVTRGGTDLQSTADPKECPSEDLGSDNGILDPNEDENMNGVLDPGNVVSVPTSVITDANGSALFNLTYGQEFGAWTEIKLTASTEVNGTESVDTEIFRLFVLATDVNTADTAPPGVRRADITVNELVDPDFTNNVLISPFGWTPVCNEAD